MNDGTYIAPYNLQKTGLYVMRVRTLVPGLNATYFKSTTLGRLRANDFNKVRGKFYVVHLQSQLQF